MNLLYILKNRGHYCDEALIRIKCLFYAVTMRINAWWWNVDMGQNVVFYGLTYFKRLPGSSIAIGKNCTFLSKKTSNKVGLYCPCMLSTAARGAQLIIGNNCGFSGTRIWSAMKITIGNNVRCGANTLIMDTDAHTDDSRAGQNEPVVIDDGVWLGMNVTVLKGVHIGKGSVIGAGSIVTKDIPVGVLAAGIPCKVIKELSV